ncbi:NAD(P)/FAD-dependent oxidoreductase [Streptomyces sp. NPDC008086]|uniref:NAD(P)/FAD-dependent oxidoreductase n=1 Tax=Streptomyces sp. NPDC008086 TaxID=3364807 RepID=UPI0036ED759D
MREILIAGGGYAGFYTAWGLEKTLLPGEARITIVDPRPYMTYQPFLPEVTAGSVEARHSAVSLRRTRLIAGTVTEIRNADRTVTVRPANGADREIRYDILVVTAGAVTRTFSIPGLTQQAIGLKHVEEAVAICDRLMTAFDQAASLPPGPERQKLLTVTFVGGGFSGVEGFGELLSLATAMLKSYPELSLDDLSFHLVEARGRILPEVSDGPGAWVVRSLERRGARVHLNTQVESVQEGRVVLSDGEEFESALIVWTAGNASNPVVHNHTDLPVDKRGLLLVRPDLRVGTDSEPVPDVSAAGDDATVPDLAFPVPGARTVPNAQHAVRQGRLLAKNLAAHLRAGRVRNYRHSSLGVVATLGRGIFQYKGIVIKGLPAWLMHRGYHVLAVPTWERKVRVPAAWITAALFGRDLVSLASVQHLREAFVTSEEAQGFGVSRASEETAA